MNPMQSKSLCGGEPAGAEATAEAAPAGAAEHREAALELGREQHEFQGPMDVVKGLLMWDETTEERVRKNLDPV